MKHARATIMTRSMETLVAERRHDLDLVLRHGAERVAAMVRAAGRFFRVAVAAQIGGHDRELGSEARSDFVPGQMREGVAVHEQERRTGAAMHRDDAGAARLYLTTDEAFEHRPALRAEGCADVKPR